MKENELRIGNLVESIIQLTGSLPEKCRFDGDIMQVNKYFIFHDLHEKCKGIPLTEEWLKKLGFYKLGDYEIYNFDDYQVEKRGNGFHFFIDNFLKTPASRSIQYVHQLQNLYFVLTGEELTAK